MAQEETQEAVVVVEEKSMTCKECFCWLPTKKGYICALSGRKRLGAMTVCQFVESRRAFCRDALSVAP